MKGAGVSFLAGILVNTKGYRFLDECVQCVRVFRKRVFPQEIIIDSWRHSHEMISKCQMAHIAFFQILWLRGEVLGRKFSATKQKQLCSLRLCVTKYLCYFLVKEK